MASEISLENDAGKSGPKKGRLLYESLLRSMPKDIVRELARRRLDEIAAYRKQRESERSEKRRDVL